MEKIIRTFCALLATCGLMAFGYMNWGNETDLCRETPTIKSPILHLDLLDGLKSSGTPPLLYDVNSRFVHTITKEKLYRAATIIDILPEKATRGIDAYQEVVVSIIHDDQETTIQGMGAQLNQEQKQLLQSADYSANFYIRANFGGKSAGDRDPWDRHLIYYMTVTPEKEAEYIDGHEALIDYLKENSSEEASFVKQDQLRPGMVRFTISKNGTIEKIILDSTSGYPSFDNKLVKLLNNMPKKWIPATNSAGEKVDQQLILFFGTQGC